MCYDIGGAISDESIITGFTEGIHRPGGPKSTHDMGATKSTWQGTGNYDIIIF